MSEGLAAPPTAAPVPPPSEGGHNRPRSDAGQKWHERLLRSRFLVISIGVHLLFGAIAAYVVVSRYQAARKLTFKGGPPSPNPSTRAMEHKVQMAKKQSTMSAPAAAKKITTKGLAKVTLPEMPAIPKVAAPPMKMAGAGGDVSFAGGSQSGGSGQAGGAAVPFFGFRESRGGGSLIGRFYDLKQTKDGKPSGINEGSYPGEVTKFTQGWNESTFDRFFVGPNPLYTTQVFIPRMSADQGPLAFGLGGRVQPKMWVVHYKGKVIPPENGTYRFVGMADDILVVRFNGAVVLDCGPITPTGHGPSQYYASAGLQIDPKKQGMEWYKGLGRGNAFNVTAGESYPMEVLIGESPGIDFKAWLLIEKDGVEYQKDAKGNPILPLFRLTPGQPQSGGSEAPVFSKEGPVWKAEKQQEPAAASTKR